MKGGRRQETGGRKKNWAFLFALLRLCAKSLLFLLPAAAQAHPVERFTLANGLTILVQPEPRLPLVQVAVMYRVGSVNEAPGITGVAHYTEHMCFRATRNISREDITGAIDRIGGRWTGYTSLDQTYYAATVPSWALEEMLRSQAERMSNALFDPQEFERERTSVIAELQGYENDPQFWLWNLAVATSFEIHPYRYNITGWLDDLLGITRDEAYSFYKRSYGPNNAVLAVVGDVDPQQVRRLASRHFGDIPALAARPQVRTREPVQAGEKRVRLLRPTDGQGLLIVYRAPAVGDPDFPVMLVLDAVLAGGRSLFSYPGQYPALPSSRLQRIVEEAGGDEASTAWTPTRFPYVYGLGLQAGKGADLAKLESRLESELKGISRQGVSDEELAQARLRLDTANALENRLADRAELLAYYETMGDWRLAGSILQAVGKVTSEDVRAFVRKWLRDDRRTVALQVAGSVDDQRAPVQAAATPDEPVAAPAPPPERALQPVAAAPIESARRELENGVRLAAARREGEVTTLYLRLALGSSLDPPGKAGLGRLAVRLLIGDPQRQEALQKQGVIWRSQADEAPSCTAREYYDLSFRFLDRQRNTVLPLIGQLLQPGGFAAVEVERMQKALLDEAEARQADPEWRAREAALRGAGLSTLKDASTIGAADVKHYFETHWKGGALRVGWVGPGDPKRVLEELSPLFSRLPSGAAPTPTAAEASPGASEPHFSRIPLPGKTQVQLAAALPGVSRNHPDALALRLLNFILGETGYAGRLGDALVDTGLAYSVYAQFDPGRLSCPWLIETAASQQDAEKSRKTIQSVIEKLGRDGVATAELRQAQAFRLGRLVYGLDSDPNLARTLAEGEYYGEDLLDLPARSAAILSVTHEQLNAVARRYCRPEALSFGLAGAPE